MSQNVLVIVAHCDDETIGMGATIKKHKNLGDDVRVVAMTDGVSSRAGSAKEDIAKRLFSAQKASKILGFEWAKILDFPDNAMDQKALLDIVKKIEDVKTHFKAEMVYTHSPADLNIDHRIVTNAVLTSFRPQPNEICKEIRLFEVASATDYGNAAITGSFSPNLFIDAVQTWDAKLEALKAYEFELREYPHCRSLKGIQNLAQLRGNQVGLHMAEAFQVIRKIE